MKCGTGYFWKDESEKGWSEVKETVTRRRAISGSHQQIQGWWDQGMTKIRGSP